MEEVLIPVVSEPRPPADRRFNLHNLPLKSNAPDGTHLIANPGFSDARIMLVAFSEGGAYACSGSAVLVGPGVAIGAGHVFEDLLPKLERGAAYAVCVGLGPEYGLIWAIDGITLVGNGDIAILSLALKSAVPPTGELRMVPITTRLPEVGEKIVVYGFVPENASFAAVGDGGFLMTSNLYASKGAVTQLFYEGRDMVMMPGPCLEVDCHAFGSMSGGPVFDEYGKLLGVISTSLTLEHGGCSPTYVSLLWPGLTVPFVGGWPVRFSEPASLIQRAKHGYGFHIDNPDALRLRFRDGQEELVLRKWSVVPRQDG